MEFKEATLIINEKNEQKLEENMVIAIIFGFNELKIDNQNSFAIQLADTIIITSKGAEVITKLIPTAYDQVSYTLEGIEKQPSSTSSKKKSKPKSKMSSSKTGSVKKSEKASSMVSTSTGLARTRSKTLGTSSLPMPGINEETQTISNHQKQLITLKIKEYKERLENNGFEKFELKNRMINLEDLQCYKLVKELPKELRKNEISLDRKRFTILFPMGASHFPIHICLLKNVSKFVEHPFMYVRFNLYHFQEKLNKEVIFPTKNPGFCFKELCYRSTDHSKMHNLFKSVKDLQKDFKLKGILESQEEDEEAENQVLKSQVLGRLKDVKFRPVLSGRKTMGTLELHENGLKFVSTKSETVDIFFSDIKQAFFQPCNRPEENDYLIIIHFHCKKPIKVLNKFYDDVQVFIEAAGSVADIGKIKKGESDDEDDEDEYEKKKRIKLNKEFEEFVKLIEKETKGKISFDIPFKELSFIGVPNKALVSMQPTVKYLLNLAEKPFFILNMDEIDFACLERIQVIFLSIYKNNHNFSKNYGKNFDVAFIYKDLTKPFKRVCNIPKEFCESIKSWLE